jgi:hypothetical protein
MMQRFFVAWKELAFFLFRRKWYETSEIDAYFNQDIKLNLAEQNISSNDYSQDIELTVTAPLSRESTELLTDNTITLFTLLRIARLDVLFNEIFFRTLIDLIDHLPNLDSLRVRSVSLLKPQCVTDEQASTRCLLSNNNKITKVNIQCLTQLAQIKFLIDLCPNMQYLEIECLNNINPKLLIRFISTKKFQYIYYPCILCLHIPTKTDKIFEELREMIKFEKLYHHCKIKRLYNKIYLQCK